MTRPGTSEPPLQAPSARYGAGRIRGKRILYVDDNPSVRRLTNGLLRDAGAICLLADTHDQAVKLAGAEPELALAMLDFQMPDGDVGRLICRLRIARPLLPLIGTSGTDHREDFADYGVTQFLEKPWPLGDLVRCLDFALPPHRTPGSMSVRDVPARIA